MAKTKHNPEAEAEVAFNFVLTPAYGRKYKNGADAEVDLLADKDFIHETRAITGGGLYINRKDIFKWMRDHNHKHVAVNIRNHRMTLISRVILTCTYGPRS